MARLIINRSLAAPVLSASTLAASDLSFTSSQPGDLYYSYEASATPLTGAAIETAALVPATDQTANIGFGGYTGALQNYPTSAGTYYLQYVVKNGDGLYSNVIVESFTISTPVLTMVQNAAVGPTGAFGTSHSLTLPSGITNGNDLLLEISTGATVTVSTPTGWTALSGNPIAQSGAGNTYHFKKTASSDSGATVSFTTSGNTVCAGFVYEMILPGHNIEVASTTASADPPSITPTGGSAERIWIAACVVERSTGSISAAPSGYSGLTAGYSSSPGSAGAGERKVGSAYKVATLSTEDPGAFTFTAHTQHLGVTIAAW